MEYKASLDITAKVVTLIVVGILLFCALNSIKQILSSDDITTRWVHGIVLFSLVGIIVLSWIFAPNRYSINEASLIIHRPVSDISFEANDIQQARLVEDSDLNGMVRTFGVGGLFGYFGKFRSSKLGGVTLYSTQHKNQILILFKNGEKVILSPNEPDRFLTDLQKRS